MNFFGYLNYKQDDFVVSLSEIWKWLGYGRQVECKKFLSRL